MNYNPTNKLGITARLGWLGYNFKNPAMFGALGGLPINNTAAKAGTGLGDTYTFTGSGSYVVSPNFLIDTYAGITTIEVLSEPDRMDEQLGLDFLGIPGHERTDPRGRRMAALRHHQLLGHRVRGQRQLALRRRQLAGAVHRQRDLHQGCAHVQVRRRHREAGDEPPRARQRIRQLHLRRRSDGAVRRSVGQPVQHVRVVSARPSDRRVARASFPSKTDTREAATGSSASS